MGILIRGGVQTVDAREPKHMVMGRPAKSKLQSPNNLLALRRWPGFVALAGIENRGRGEWLLSLASVLAEPERPVYLADLTERRSFFRDPVIAVRIKRTMSDVCALTPDDEEEDLDPRLIKPEIERRVKGRGKGRALLDVGASGQGAAVLGELRANAPSSGCEVLLVINPFNPRTADGDNTRALKIFIEGFPGLTVTGLVAAPRRGRHDEPRFCAEGAMNALVIAQALELPLLYVLADDRIAEKVSALLPGKLPVWPVPGLENDYEEDEE